MMTYQFKESTRVPTRADGQKASANGVMAEYYMTAEVSGGHASAANAAKVVMANPEKYPNLRAFGPADAEEALRLGIQRGISEAFRSVVIIREPKTKDDKPRMVRVLHSVHDEEGEQVFKPLEVISRDKGMRKDLLAQLRNDAKVFAAKVEVVLAELDELI